VGILYLAALIVGFGTIALQLVMSGDSDSGADVHAGGDVHVDADHGDSHGLHADGGFLPIFVSLRFWTFLLLAFGLSGTLLHYLDLANPMIVLPIAAVLGVVSGLVASLTFRALGRSEANSAASTRETVGQVGKVLIPLDKNSRGKVRIELKGQTVDLLATTDDEGLEAGQMVLIEEVRETTAHVSRAPAELLPPKRD
jgi:membrane protein implicated in regulation of membrane protease activity